MGTTWGDRELALFHASKYLVHQVLATYPHRHQRDLYQDMYSHGLIGLWHAIDTYDNRGSFRTWAKSKIAWAIQDGLRELDLISRASRDHIKQLTEVNNELSQELGATPTWAQLRARGVNTEKAVWAAQFAKQDEPPFFDDWLDVHTTPSPEDILIDRDTEQRMGQLIAKLPSQMSVIVELIYYGEYEQQEVGEILGLSASRICQIHRQAMHRLRRLAADEFT